MCTLHSSQSALVVERTFKVAQQLLNIVVTAFWNANIGTLAPRVTISVLLIAMFQRHAAGHRRMTCPSVVCSWQLVCHSIETGGGAPSHCWQSFGFKIHPWKRYLYVVVCNRMMMTSPHCVFDQNHEIAIIAIIINGIVWRLFQSQSNKITNENECRN